MASALRVVRLLLLGDGDGCWVREGEELAPMASPEAPFALLALGPEVAFCPLRSTTVLGPCRISSLLFLWCKLFHLRLREI